MRKSIQLFILLLCLKFSTAQDVELFKPDSVKKTLESVKIFSNIRVDGILNEKEWLLAKASPDFIQVEPVQGAKASQPTTVKVLFNRNYLYFGIFSADSLGKKAIRANDFKRDFNYRQHDLVSITFDGFNDERNAMLFATNPYGVQHDLLAFDNIYFDMDWDGLWKVRTHRTDSGWYAEIAIPWQTLRYPPLNDSIQSWGINLYRSRRVTNEITAFSPYPRSFSSMRMDYAGKITQLQPPPPKTNIRIQPYVLTSYDQYKGYDADIKPHSSNFKVGGDLKWAINTNNVLDLTANTDFAQADADRQVNNITRFSVFFPERRQFFLENASLFGPGIAQNDDGSGGSMRIQPFFSRSIGLDDSGNPIPIQIGGRYVHRSEQRNFGAMLMRQSGDTLTPATNFFVGRFYENIGKQSRLGGMVNIRNRPDGTNLVSMVDGFVRLGEKHSLNSFMIHSTDSKTGKQGVAGAASYFYTTNYWKIWLTQTVVTKDFNPAMGFVSRSDVIGTTPGFFYYYRGKHLPFKKILRAFEPGAFPEFYFQASTGKLIEQSLGLNPVWLNFQNGAYFGYSIVPTYQRILENFEPLGITILPGEYRYTMHHIWASTDPSRKLNLQFKYGTGAYFNGKLNSGEWVLQFAPSPHFSLTGTLNRNKFKKVGTPATNATVDLYSIEGRIALNPRIQLIGFYQQNSENRSRNYNIRLSWEYQPLSFIYLVYNRRAFDPLQRKRLTEDHVIAKISYLKQF